jgi:hypothetical protein
MTWTRPSCPLFIECQEEREDYKKTQPLSSLRYAPRLVELPRWEDIVLGGIVLR